MGLWAKSLLIFSLTVAGDCSGRDTTDHRAVDETFLQHLMLVFMDLASGYLLVAEVAVDRTYDTWHGLVQAQLKTLGVEVVYLVSDRAKALIKLVEISLDCLSLPEFISPQP
jgi:hypothetical protein